MTAPAHPHTLACTESVLGGGLRVRAYELAGSPLVELRLRIPFAGADLASAMVLAESLLSGTTTSDRDELDRRLRRVGGTMSAQANADHLTLRASVLHDGLGDVLGVLSEVLRAASYPEPDVAAASRRCAEQAMVATSSPSVLASEALNRRLYRDHPYGESVPRPDVLRSVSADALRDLHHRHLAMDGALLVLAGDVDPDEAVTVTRAHLGDLAAGTATVHPPPEFQQPGTVLDQLPTPQSYVRIGFAAVARQHEDFAALQLANMVFGGYFSSRLVTRLREEDGYTYSPRASFAHLRACSVIGVSADVASADTAAALRRIHTELAQCAQQEPSLEELDRARRYTIGTLQLGLATQASVADTAANFGCAGIDLDWLPEHFERLRAVSAAQVRVAAERYLAPEKAVAAIFTDPGVDGLDEACALGVPDTARNSEGI